MPAEPKVEKTEAPELPKMPQAPEPQQTQQQAQADQQQAQQQAQTQQQAPGQVGQTQQSNFGNQFQGVQDQVTSGFHEFQNIVTGNTFKNYLIEGYKNPIEAVRIGCEGAMLKEGLIIYFAKDILCALFMMLRDLGHFPVMLIVLLALDAVQLFISLGIGKAFGGKASMAQWFGAMVFGAYIAQSQLSALEEMLQNFM